MVVVVSSIYPSVVNSLYHATKRLQDELLNILRCSLNERKIGLSIIKVGWVNTNMYRNYVRVTGNCSKEVVEPEIVAKCCTEEFSHSKPFNLRDVK